MNLLELKQDIEKERTRLMGELDAIFGVNQVYFSQQILNLCEKIAIENVKLETLEKCTQIFNKFIGILKSHTNVRKIEKIHEGKNSVIHLTDICLPIESLNDLIKDLGISSDPNHSPQNLVKQDQGEETEMSHAGCLAPHRGEHPSSGDTLSTKTPTCGNSLCNDSTHWQEAAKSTENELKHHMSGTEKVEGNLGYQSSTCEQFLKSENYKEGIQATNLFGNPPQTTDIHLTKEELCECGHTKEQHSKLEYCSEHGQNCSKIDCLKSLKGLMCYCHKFIPKSTKEVSPSWVCGCGQTNYQNESGICKRCKIKYPKSTKEVINSQEQMDKLSGTTGRSRVKADVDLSEKELTAGATAYLDVSPSHTPDIHSTKNEEDELNDCRCCKGICSCEYGCHHNHESTKNEVYNTVSKNDDKLDSIEYTSKGCGKKREHGTLICGRIYFNPINGDENYLYLCNKCRESTKNEICPFTGKKGYIPEEDCHCFCCGTHSPVSDESDSLVEGIGAIPREEAKSNVYNVERDAHIHSHGNTPPTKPEGETKRGKISDNLMANQIAENTSDHVTLNSKNIEELNRRLSRLEHKVYQIKAMPSNKESKK